MQAIILAATHDRKLTSQGKEVPLPLVDLKDEEEYLTTLVKRLATTPGVSAVTVVTNDAIKPDLDAWRAKCPPIGVPVHVISDGTKSPEDKRGAVGDLVFVIRTLGIQDELLIVGGDNWFTFDLAEFVSRARQTSPAVIVRRVTLGTRSQRFGWVRLDPDSRIVEFLEHPGSDAQVSDRMLKASCVYYLAAEESAWLDAFAKDHSTVCSPGTFFAWLKDQIRVYGINMNATFYDMESRGSDLLEFRDMVLRMANPNFGTWERSAARELLWVSSHEDLIEALEDQDPNKRILAARLLGRAGSLLSEVGKRQVIESLLSSLSDGAINDIGYGTGFQSDEDEATYVSATAAESLAKLGFAESAAEVFKEAERRGIPVEITKNIY